MPRWCYVLHQTRVFGRVIGSVALHYMLVTASVIAREASVEPAAFLPVVTIKGRFTERVDGDACRRAVVNTHSVGRPVDIERQVCALGDSWTVGKSAERIGGEIFEIDISVYVVISRDQYGVICGYRAREQRDILLMRA